MRRESRAYREGTWSVASNRPTPTSVQRRSLLSDDTDNAAAAERFRIDLTLDFEHIKWEENHLADTRQAARGRLHHQFALPFAKCVRIVRPVVPCKHVVDPGLAAKLVNPL